MTITVYSKNNCPGCDQLKRKLTQKGVEFEEKNISTDPLTLEWLLAQGHRSVPVVYQSGVHVVDMQSIFD